MVMKPNLIGSLATGIILIVSATANAESNRYTFKGATLGMSVEEFRVMAFPDVGKKPYLAKSVPRTFRVHCAAESDLLTGCWFEAWSEERVPVCALNAKDLEAHIQRMKRVHPKQPLTMSDVEKTCFRRIDVGFGGRSPAYDSDITYLFHNGRLLWIDIMMWSKDTEILYPQLKIAYGTPTHETEPLVQNRMAVTFQNRVTIWDNGEDVITLTKYDGSIKYGRFNFTHRPTLQRYQAARAAATRDAAKDF